jgi:hypothetical protein
MNRTRQFTIRSAVVKQLLVAGARAIVAMVTTAVMVAIAAQATPQSGITEGPRLSAVYELILQAQFTEAEAALARTCPPAPADACLPLRAAAIWWQIQMDPDNRALDARLQEVSRAAIDATARWTEREPRRAEAWFFHAGAYAPLTQWRVLRGERLAAARDGLRIKNALERAIALDPSLHDAYFGIGLYHYYADVAPAGLKMLRWLLLLPGGDREQGLREMLRARDQGVMLAGEADFQLHWLYLWYEHDPERALALLAGLDRRYPTNPLFLQRIAEVHRNDRQDPRAARDAWQSLLDRARAGRVQQPAMTETRARLGLADALISTNESARAVDLAAPVIAARATAPYGALARAFFLTGRAYEQLDDRSRARSAFTSAIDSAPRDDPDRIRARAREALSRVRVNR